MNQLDLAGRHAVVTGGATGLGFAIAQRLLASHATVTLWDINAAALDSAKAQLGATVSTVVVDVSDPTGVAAAVRQTCPIRRQSDLGLMPGSEHRSSIFRFSASGCHCCESQHAAVAFRSKNRSKFQLSASG